MRQLSRSDRDIMGRRGRRLQDSKIDSAQEHLVGIGSVILGRLWGDAEEGALEYFRIYSGIGEGCEFRIFCSVDKSGSDWFLLLTGDGDLVCESSTLGPDGWIFRRVELDSPEDFLDIDPGAVEALYEDLMRDGFWDRVAFKHAHDGKPGYENVWREKERATSRMSLC